MQYKLELEKTNKSKHIKTYSAREIIDNKNKQAHSKMQQNNQIYVVAVKSRIGNKILKINQKMVFDRIRNDVPTDIAFIITQIANGTLDTEIANEIIDKEAKKRIEKNQKLQFH